MSRDRSGHPTASFWRSSSAPAAEEDRGRRRTTAAHLRNRVWIRRIVVAARRHPVRRPRERSHPAGRRLGGVPTVAVKPDPALKEVGAAWPYFLPDGRHFLFMSTDVTAPPALKIGSLDDENTTVLGDIKSRVEYAAGHLFYVAEQTLMARPFDLDTLAFAGEPFPVTDRMQLLGATGLVDFSTSMSRRSCLHRRRHNFR